MNAYDLSDALSSGDIVRERGVSRSEAHRRSISSMSTCSITSQKSSRVPVSTRILRPPSAQKLLPSGENGFPKKSLSNVQFGRLRHLTNLRDREISNNVPLELDLETDDHLDEPDVSFVRVARVYGRSGNRRGHFCHDDDDRRRMDYERHCVSPLNVYPHRARRVESIHRYAVRCDRENDERLQRRLIAMNDGISDGRFYNASRSSNQRPIDGKIFANPMESMTVPARTSRLANPSQVAFFNTINVGNLKDNIYFISGDANSESSPAGLKRRPKVAPNLPGSPKKRRFTPDVSECFKCPDCSFISLFEEDVVRHVEEFHQDDYRQARNPTSIADVEVRCMDCSEIFSSIGELKRHVWKSHGTGKIMFQAVPVQVENSTVWDSDEEDRSNDSPFSRIDEDSPACHEWSPVSEYSDNIGVDSEQNDSKPSIADSGLGNGSDCSSPPPGSCDARVFECGVQHCRVKFASLEDVQTHRKCHKDGVFICQTCQETYSEWVKLSMHMWKQHSIDVGLLKCRLCKFKHASENGINAHQSVHQRYQIHCSICDRNFRSSESCQKHMVKFHQSEQIEFSCTDCPRRFFSHRLLMRHVDRTHLKLRDFKCSACSATFVDKHRLEIHVRSHTGSKPLCCNQCSFRTRHPSNLARHLKNHDGATPYSCPECSFKSIHPHPFKSHVAKMHPDKVATILSVCPVCCKNYMNADTLARHLVSVHPEYRCVSPKVPRDDTSSAAISEQIGNDPTASAVGDAQTLTDELHVDPEVVEWFLTTPNGNIEVLPMGHPDYHMLDAVPVGELNLNPESFDSELDLKQAEIQNALRCGSEIDARTLEATEVEVHSFRVLLGWFLVVNASFLLECDANTRVDGMWLSMEIEEIGDGVGVILLNLSRNA
ncbi:unnamed protein product [Notodromas monacha]|uniref:C2H2-type domain-containing protein n=1 Tax=Notodromas monacha TaxID=399045 RepID=A0A7R9BES5_9CRUS|nr:unnamed protein product [Notodromas monacha]CAG0912475.1 unnamed protein product [Notodromas monacha]